MRRGLDKPKKFDVEAKLRNAAESAKKSSEWIAKSQKADHEKHGGVSGQEKI